MPLVTCMIFKQTLFKVSKMYAKVIFQEVALLHTLLPPTIIILDRISLLVACRMSFIDSLISLIALTVWTRVVVPPVLPPERASKRLEEYARSEWSIAGLFKANGTRTLVTVFFTACSRVQATGPAWIIPIDVSMGWRCRLSKGRPVLKRISLTVPKEPLN